MRQLTLLIYLAILLPLFVACGSARCIQRDHPVQPLPSFELPTNIRVALVLGSGGVRGMAHVGVLEELIAAGIPIDLIVGCSAGSIVGALYADTLSVEKTKRAVAELRTHSILDISLLHCRFGLSQSKLLYRVLDQHLKAEQFKQLKVPLVIVASDLHTGELVPLGGGDLVKAIQASCSIPFVFVPCKHLGRVLVDGGVINPVPVQVARDLGAQLIIAVDLAELLPQTLPTNLFGVATRSAEIAFLWQNDECTRQADIVIRPRTCDCGAFDDSKKWQIYEAGKNAAREQLPRIVQALASCRIGTHTGPQDCPSKEISARCHTPGIYRSDSGKKQGTAETSGTAGT
jgi:NTE family protein